MMRKAITVVLLGCTVFVRAQETAGGVEPSGLHGVASDEAAAGVLQPAVGDSVAARPIKQWQPLLPALTHTGTVAHYPYIEPLGGWNDWSLHSGFNVALSAAASFAFGKYSGLGFSQTLSLMYAQPLSPRLSLAVGGYYSHFNWGMQQFNNAGLNAVLDFRFNEHWESYIYAQKSLLTPNMPVPLYWLSDIGDRIGAAVRYHFSPSFSVELNVSTQSRSGDNRFRNLNSRNGGF